MTFEEETPDPTDEEETPDPILPPQVSKRLGCSQHVAYIQSKCNGPRLCQLLDATSLQYDRRLDDISEAFVEVAISGDVDSPCCSCLADAEPWCHQLTIEREGDGVVWTGPIQKVIYGFDKVRIEARDKMAWLKVRVNELTLDYSTNTTVELTTIAKTICEVAMADDSDSPCFMDCVQDLGDGIINAQPGERGRLFPAFGGPTAYDDVQSLADTGINFTVVANCLLLFGKKLPPIAIGRLTDEQILGEVEVVKDGNQQGNRFSVRYEHDDDCPGICTPQGAITCPCPGIASGPRTVTDGVTYSSNLVTSATAAFTAGDRGASISGAGIPPGTVIEGVVSPTSVRISAPATASASGVTLTLANSCYGLIERLIPNDLGVPNVDAAQVVAQAYLAAGRIAPRLIEFPSGTRLSPETPWHLSDMIPGQRIDVSLQKLCVPVYQSFKLQQVTVEDSGTGEQISIDLRALDAV